MGTDRVTERIDELSPAKRQLLARMLEREAYDASWLDAPVPVSPKSPLEAELAAVWAEVLGLESVGVEDSFFDLGGDSILSIRIVAKAQRAGIPLTSRQLFEAPTISRLARQVEAARAAGSAPRPVLEAPVVAARPEPRLGPAPSPADFPEAELDQRDLDSILARVVRWAAAADSRLSSESPSRAAAV